MTEADPAGVAPGRPGAEAAPFDDLHTPIAVTAQKAALQPQCSPTSAPNGTPSTFATVSPANMTATARAPPGTRAAMPAKASQTHHYT
jgi:hypothetical protein